MWSSILRIAGLGRSSSSARTVLILLVIGLAAFIIYKVLQSEPPVPRAAPAVLRKSEDFNAVLEFDEHTVTWMPIKLSTGYETLRAITFYTVDIPDGIYYGRLLTEDTSGIVELLKIFTPADVADVILQKQGRLLIFVLAGSFDDLAGLIENRPKPVTDDLVEYKITAKLNVTSYEEAFETIKA